MAIAKANNCGIKFEDLKGIRKNRKNNKTTRGTLNSWSFYQVRLITTYKAHQQGIPVATIDPAFTSQNCSKCLKLGKRDKKVFECGHCGHTDHADSNAAFNIAAAPLV